MIEFLHDWNLALEEKFVRIIVASLYVFDGYLSFEFLIVALVNIGVASSSQELCLADVKAIV